MSYSQQIGKLGEELARKFLISKGYLVLTSNFRIRRGEVDLICQKADTLVFVEVKTRTNQAFGYPEESFNFRKKERFTQAISRYLVTTKYAGSWQVDLISLEINKNAKKAQIRHYQAVEL